jgi:alpha-mannosidase II
LIITFTFFLSPNNLYPKPVNDRNVKAQSELLLDQYRKKSQLFAHNVLLVPLGEDFRYSSIQEAKYQFENYERLIEYMNSNEEMNVEIKFGTLSDYFDLVNKQSSETGVEPKSLSGDFFTYADRFDDYWSGYYTSRPFSKKLGRIVEHYLRTAEILFSISNIIQAKSYAKVSHNKSNELYGMLLSARKNVSLFQHHDAITGTSSQFVVLDYNKK